MCALVKISASVYFSDHITRGPLHAAVLRRSFNPMFHKHKEDNNLTW